MTTILFEMGHPAHVHHFKHVIWELQKGGHTTKIIAKEKEMTFYLLDVYGFQYEKIGRNVPYITGKAMDLLRTDMRLLKIAKEFNPDVMISRGSPYSAHISAILNKPHIAFCDTEHARLNDLLAYPFTDIICTPSCFKKDLGKKHLRYNGYKELSYLSPKYFKPNKDLLRETGLNPDTTYAIIRKVAWAASHDLGKADKADDLTQLHTLLEKNMEVYSIAEGSKQLPIPPEHFHHALAFATIVVSDGATVASEAAVLGVPSIYVSPLAGTMGVLEELEKRYGLLKSFKRAEDAIEAVQSILMRIEKVEVKHRDARARLIAETVDVTAFMTKLIKEELDAL